MDELKKCGDKLYVRNQYWEIIDITKAEMQPEARDMPMRIKILPVYRGCLTYA